MAELKTKPSKIVKLVKESNFYTTETAIQAAMESALKKEKTLRTEFQLIGCSLIKKLAVDGDIRQMVALIESLKETSLDFNSMRVFLVKYSQLQYVAEDKINEVAESYAYDKTKQVQLGTAMEKAWWKAAPRPVAMPYSIFDAIRRIVETAEKRKDNEKEGDIIPSNILNELRALLPDTEAESDDSHVEGEGSEEVGTLEDVRAAA